MQTIRELLEVLPQSGAVEWIGVRPARRAAVQSLSAVAAEAGRGLAGDHYSKQGGNRQVTLIQAEHLDAVASLLGIAVVQPGTVRRNLVIRGINLLALKDRQFRVGAAILEYRGPCQPCSLMEAVLGPGGYNAMRGHGGITAAVIEGGTIRVADAVVAMSIPE